MGVAKGGTATTANALSFGFLFLVEHTEVQTLVQEEIDRVVGTYFPMMVNMKNMPYTQVVLFRLIIITS
jgi:cytochrome P450